MKNILTAKPRILEYLHILVFVPIGYILLFSLQSSNEIDLIASEHTLFITVLHAFSILVFFLSKFFKQHWGPLFRAIVPAFLSMGIVLSLAEFIHFFSVTGWAFLVPIFIPLIIPWLSLLAMSGYMVIELLAVLRYNYLHIDPELFQSKWAQTLYLTYYGRYGWVFQILTFPFYVVFVQLILVICNQQTNSLILAFTESKNGVFSEHFHDFLNSTTSGATEYVCTVASYGSPNLVKPIGIGHRKDGTILVNRQLQICNAFEEWLHQKLPRVHRPLRKFYDGLQIPVEKWKSVKYVSNIMFILIKPLEWFCFLCLYFFQSKPENMIGKQYLQIPKSILDETN